MRRDGKDVSSQGSGECLKGFADGDAVGVLAFDCYAEGFAVGGVAVADLLDEEFATQFFDFGVEVVAGNSVESGFGFCPFELIG